MHKQVPEYLTSSNHNYLYPTYEHLSTILFWSTSHMCSFLTARLKMDEDDSERKVVPVLN
jgi:hypothetical protein